MSKQPGGPVIYDVSKCIGCRYCMVSCPFDIPKFEYNEWNPRLIKCTMCFERQKDGKKPACVEACPTGARVFGNLLDPKSEIRFVLKNKKVFRLKEDLGTDPKFWYFVD